MSVVNTLLIKTVKGRLYLSGTSEHNPEDVTYLINGIFDKLVDFNEEEYYELEELDLKTFTELQEWFTPNNINKITRLTSMFFYIWNWRNFFDIATDLLYYSDVVETVMIYSEDSKESLTETEFKIDGDAYEFSEIFDKRYK